jgi:7-cyano-7-deazaguanine synthase
MRVVCIVSGGLDSICTAAYLTRLKKYDVFMMSFMYGQRAMYREVRQADFFAKTLNVQDHRIVDISFMKELYGNSNSLTDKKQQLSMAFDYSIVVPMRNAIFITIAAAWAMSINAEMVAYGAHTGDSHYPDCRPQFTKSIANALNLSELDGIKLGLRKKISVWSPALDGIDKAEILRIGYKILGDRIFKAWSCYSEGIRIKGKEVMHCGKCESCINRKIAISKAGLEDKTCYARNNQKSTAK